MKKKFGFTLAEVLITLTVIGIVSALAAPVLVGAFQKSKVGPSLRKMVSTLENANEMLLQQNDVEKLSYVASDTDTYLTKLAGLVKGSVAEEKQYSKYDRKTYAGTEYKSAQGSEGTDEEADDATFVYNLSGGESIAIQIKETVSKPNNEGSYKGIYANFYYDINGAETKPNKIGKDIFMFVMDDNGSVIANGGKTYASAYSKTPKKIGWEATSGNLACNESKVGNGSGCAGSIADNGWKVIYKY